MATVDRDSSQQKIPEKQVLVVNSSFKNFVYFFCLVFPFCSVNLLYRFMEIIAVLLSVW